MKEKKVHSRVFVNKSRAIVWSVILGLLSLSFIFLYVFALITSFKSQLDLLENVMGLPSKKFGWKWSNYITAFEIFYVPVSSQYGSYNVYLPELFLNSVLYSVGCAFVITATHFVVAYLVARYKMAISTVVFNIVIVVMVVPIYGSLPAELKMARTLGLYDSIIGQYIMKMSFLGTYFLIFYGAVKSLGNEYAEAASIDGAGPLSIMLRIYLPLVSSVFIGIFILYFIGFWADYMTPLYYMPSYPVVGYALNYIQYGTDTKITVPIILATSIMSAIPSLITFICFRNRIMGNMTFGGLKA